MASKVNSKLLTPPQKAAIEMILEGATNQEIATELGIVYDTVIRWRKQKVFARVLAAETDKVSEVAMAILQSNATHAAQRLVEMIDDAKPDRTQFNACMQVIKLVLENQMLQDFSKRLEKLEARGDREA